MVADICIHYLLELSKTSGGGFYRTGLWLCKLSLAMPMEPMIMNSIRPRPPILLWGTQIMTAISLEDKIQNVLDLLGDIEHCVQSDPSTLSSSDAKNFVDRLRSVADLVDRKCNVVEILDYESSVESDASSPTGVKHEQNTPMRVSLQHAVKGEVQTSSTASCSTSQPSVAPSLLPQSVEVKTKPRLLEREQVDRKSNVVEILDYESSDESDASSPTGVKHKESTPTPPMGVSLQHAVKEEVQTSSTASSTSQPSVAPSLPPQLPPQLPQQRSAPASMYKRFASSPPNVLDEVAKKRRLEAERMVRQLQKPKTFSCGVSYPGDQQEKYFSDGIKEDIKKRLPALRNHMHLFRYMAWATTERLECAHCRQCPNVYQ